MGGDLLGLFADLARRTRRRGARDRCRPGTPRARTVRRLVGIAFLDLDFRRWQAEIGGTDLGGGRRVTLTLAHRTQPRDRAAGGIDADVAAIEQSNPEDVADLGGSGAGDLSERGEA